MADESTAGGTNEAAKKGQAQQAAKGSEQPARSAGGSSQQQRGRGAGETRGLARRDEWFEPTGLAIPGFGGSPFSLVRRMMDDLDRMVEAFGLGPMTGGRALGRPSARSEAVWAPSLDVFEREGNLVVRADLPGLGKDDVRVEVTGDQLVLEGERRQEREMERSGMYRAERVYGAFQRVIPLPGGRGPGVRPGALRERRARGVLPARGGEAAGQAHRDQGREAVERALTARGDRHRAGRAPALPGTPAPSHQRRASSTLRSRGQRGRVARNARP